MSKPKVEIDTASLRLIQFNFIVWSSLFLTIGLHLQFGKYIPEVRTSDLFGTIMVDNLIFNEIHFTVIIAMMIVIPIIFLVNNFYQKFLIGFVKIV